MMAMPSWLETYYQGSFDLNSVNWKSNTLTDRMTKFTTISVLHATNKIILDSIDISFSNQERPADIF